MIFENTLTVNQKLFRNLGASILFSSTVHLYSVYQNSSQHFFRRFLNIFLEHLFNDMKKNNYILKRRFFLILFFVPLIINLKNNFGIS